MIVKTSKNLQYFLFFMVLTVPIFYALLFQTWYKDQFTPEFHFFDDSLEWLGMDKGGHFITAFIESWILIEWYKLLYATKETKKNTSASFIIFGLGGFFLQLPIEFMDGLSLGYGFSWFDVLANLAGSTFSTWQFYAFGSIVLWPKVSFWPSEYAHIRPNLLGSNLIEQFIKDYNGLTYWISFSPNLFLNRPLFPSWFLVSIGYGADGLLGGHDNNWIDKSGHEHDYSIIQRRNFVYFSFDLNVNELPITNRYLRSACLIFNLIKIPFWVI